MSVLDYAIGDMFIFRVIKHLATNPDRQWVNSYEFVAHAADGTGSLVVLASSIALFEATMSLNTVVFEQVIVSTWEADSKPYNPSAFLTMPLTSIGARLPAGDPLPLSQCLSLARVPESGRLGHLFYRGWLDEEQVSAPSGKPILADLGVFDTDVQEALTTSELIGYLEVDNVSGLHMAMIDKTGESNRPVLSLVTKGVAQLPTDHAWFNRPTPTP